VSGSVLGGATGPGPRRAGAAARPRPAIDGPARPTTALPTRSRGGGRSWWLRTGEPGPPSRPRSSRSRRSRPRGARGGPAAARALSTDRQGRVPRASGARSARSSEVEQRLPIGGVVWTCRPLQVACPTSQPVGNNRRPLRRSFLHFVSAIPRGLAAPWRAPRMLRDEHRLPPCATTGFSVGAATAPTAPSRDGIRSRELLRRASERTLHRGLSRKRTRELDGEARSEHALARR